LFLLDRADLFHLRLEKLIHRVEVIRGQVLSVVYAACLLVSFPPAEPFPSYKGVGTGDAWTVLTTTTARAHVQKPRNACTIDIPSIV
jgi:hypothetical protein